MELVKQISIRELMAISGVIHICTPGGEYIILVSDAAKARSIDVVNKMVDLGPIRSIAEEMKVLLDGLENPSKVIFWMMGNTEWSEWQAIAKRVGDKTCSEGFWTDDENFKIV
jgi:hypothetical protein